MSAHLPLTIACSLVCLHPAAAVVAVVALSLQQLDYDLGALDLPLHFVPESPEPDNAALVGLTGLQVGCRQGSLGPG